MRRIEWHDAFEVGNDIVDRGHQAIVTALNEAIRAVNAASGPRLAAAVAEAVEVARRHFREEESLLAGARFAGADRHAAYHRRLIGEAEAILDLCRAEASPRLLEPRIAELVHFLMAEIRDNDKDLKTCLTDAAPAVPAARVRSGGTR